MNKVEEAKKLVREMGQEEKKEFKKWCKDWNFHLSSGGRK